MLRGQQHEIVGPAEPVGGRDLDRHAKIAERARDREPLLGEQRRARAPRTRKVTSRPASASRPPK